MNRNEKIRNAYRITGSNSFYDGMITCSTFLGRLVSRIVWDMNIEDSTNYQTKALSGISEGFSGRLLEVPVGTGVLTMPVYQTIPEAQISCLDYSSDMMLRAKEKADKLGLVNIDFKQGDVSFLPFKTDSFDIVLSLNGFHAFPNKNAAYQETYRVLKNGGVFCGCFYVTGICKRTDWFIRHIYQPLKFFTPPYETIESLNMRLKSMYSQVKIDHVKSIAWFICRK
ncbi:MAG: class I SAM-dependent methyltransferase [Bacteroidales bacterium]|jgi:ubiquinone/menaquinone biosynthesis C-methylase UbiE